MPKKINIQLKKKNIQVSLIGRRGIKGPKGNDGVGVPSGGISDQVLSKKSNTNYDTEWKTLSKSDVGLGNVDNTSDLDKPISIDTQNVLNEKVNKGDDAVNVKDYGAVGDGVADDTDAFNQAMANSGVVIVPSGTYLLQYLDVPYKTHLIGVGARPQLNLYRADPNPTYGSNKSYLRTLTKIENLYINSLNDDLEWNRLGIENVTMVEISSCRIEGFRHNISAPNAWGVFINLGSSNVWIHDTVFENNSQSDIAVVDNCSNITIERVKGTDLTVNIEPNGSAHTYNVTVKDSRLSKAMFYGYSDNVYSIDGILYQNCHIDTLEYFDGNVEFRDCTIDSVDPKIVGGVMRGGLIRNTNSFGLGQELIGDKYIMRVVDNTDRFVDGDKSWFVSFAQQNNIMKFVGDIHNRYLAFNFDHFFTTCNIDKKIPCTENKVYIVTLESRTYFTGSSGGTPNVGVTFYDSGGSIVQATTYAYIDRRVSIQNDYSPWDKRSAFVKAPAGSAYFVINVGNTRKSAVEQYELNLRSVSVREVIASSKDIINNYNDDKTYVYASPNTNSINAFFQNQCITGDIQYAVDPSAGYIGYICTVGGKPGTWQRFGAQDSYVDQITTKTGNYTAARSDRTILCNALSSAITISLPAVQFNARKIYVIKKIDSSSNQVIIDANSSELIDGQTTKLLLAQGESITIQCDGISWHTIEDYSYILDGGSA